MFVKLSHRMLKYASLAGLNQNTEQQQKMITGPSKGWEGLMGL